MLPRKGGGRKLMDSAVQYRSRAADALEAAQSRAAGAASLLAGPSTPTFD